MSNDLAPFFPHTRFAILVDAKDYCTEDRELPEFHFHFGFNRNIYDWEILLTRRIDLGTVNPLNNPVPPTQQYRLASALAVEAYMLEKTFDLQGARAYATSHHLSRFEEVTKIHDSPKREERLDAAIGRYRTMAAPDSLTLLVMASHGKPGEISIGRHPLLYSELLTRLDTIVGKKCLFVYCCHSGSLIDEVIRLPTREDYAIITSCPSNVESTNWDDRGLDDVLWKAAKSRLPLSHYPLADAKADNPPQRFQGFDVTLV